MPDSQPQFRDLQPVSGTGALPKTCDGLNVTVGGTIAFTTEEGTHVTGYAATTGEHIQVRIVSIESLGGATVFAGYR